MNSTGYKQKKNSENLTGWCFQEPEGDQGWAGPSELKTKSKES